MRPTLTLLLLIFGTALTAQFSISLESGLAFSQYNDVRVPNGEELAGTLFSLDDDFSPEQGKPFLRVEAAYLIKDKHTVELTAAPLQLNFADAQLSSIRFAGTTFEGADIDGRYEFNTYRASYRYRLVQRPKFTLDLGASILARDARIALTQGELTAEDTDLGFVPLISFKLQYSPSDKLSLLLKGDALASPQGRAEDVFAGLLVDLLADKLQLKAGYRLIEGGADVDQVYNFAFIHFADVGVVYTFDN
ncbi:MAG: hypothetical protein AB8G22_27180 [Saprospiraceae bacterium]